MTELVIHMHQWFYCTLVHCTCITRNCMMHSSMKEGNEKSEPYFDDLTASTNTTLLTTMVKNQSVL